MFKISSTTYHHKFLLKIGLTALVGLIAQTALAECPDTAGINITSAANFVGSAGGNRIYFCKQGFPDASLRFAPTESQLLDKGSHAIPMGNKIQSFPLGNSINLTGFNIANLALKQLSANFPNTNGQFSSPSLFNFYIRSTDQNDSCTGEYQTIRTFLRNNPNTFQLNNSSASVASDTTSNTSIVKITGAKLKSTVDQTKDLTANIDLYYTNPTSGQFFTNVSQGYRDCWFGVGTKVTITPDSDNVGFAGNYDLQISVLTQ
ncbi:hypothetical protein [Psychrobacter pulmonis]|uniref:hypothetical protein n=1 Tax=Psychrobacter pulmonis TaxID=228654 RepID=UPI00191A370C|nr:hypothetical protein [Psychrobacter pulmonis]